MSQTKMTNKQGSIMIAALVVTLITGALVGLFLKTITLEVENSYRARMSFQAINLAEAGLEYAVHAMITGDWSEWEQGANGGYYRDSFPYISYTYRNEQRTARVYVEPDASPAPIAVAEGEIETVSGMKVSRQIYVEMTKGETSDPNKPFWFGNGITAKDTLTFSGNGQQMDSFDSRINPYGRSDILDIYDDQLTTTILGHNLARGYCSIASNSVAVEDISVGNADVYGSLATGAGEGANIAAIVGPNGSIYNQETRHGDESFVGNIDYAHVGFEFYGNLIDPEPPTLNNPITSQNGTIGTAGQATEYHLSSLSVSGKKSVTIKGDVTLIVDGDVSVSGKASIDLAPGATLKLYVDGSMQISGNGLANSGPPKNVIIFSTGNGDVSLGGNAKLSAAVYAPNSFVHLGGGGNSGAMYGAVVGKDVKLNGHYPFHYDEALKDLFGDEDDDDDGNFVPEVTRWVELTSASERKNMSTILTDGL
jgi:hypothetical protein